MAFNIEKYKKFKEEKVDKKDPKFIKLKDGDNRVRILPPLKEDGMFFLMYGQHYIDNQFVVCPKKTNDDPCPICEFVSKLYRGDEDSKTLAGQIRARDKYIYNVIDRDNEEEGVKILQTGVKIFEVIIGRVVDPDIGDITNLKSGFDVIIKKKQQGGFPNYDGTDVARKPSLLSDDIEKVKKWMNDRFDLEKEIEVKSYDELAKLLDGGEVDFEDQASEIEDEIKEKVDVQVEVEEKKEQAEAENAPSDDLMSELEEFMN